MRIAAVAARVVQAPLTRPYAIAGHRWDAVGFAVVTLSTDAGLCGHGLAAPAEEVTGETVAAAAAALREADGWLVGREADEPDLLLAAQRQGLGPAARAAIDMALCDLLARAQGQPCVEWLGRAHEALPTSITIGQKDLAATLAEAEEHLDRGFTALKVKIGSDVDEDLARLRALRQRHGARIALRADANQGYDERALLRFVAESRGLDLQFIVQPMPPGAEPFLRTLPADVQRLLMADESVLDAAGLTALLAQGCPYGSVNIKLMKCGGLRPALELARLCDRHGLGVMWGCNDESVLGIAAALHAAYAAPATRFLDLDGSLDLAVDPFVGGVSLAGGVLRTLARPGLGAEPV